MTVVLQNGSARQLTPCELAELNGEAPAHSGRQSCPGHDRCRKSLLHGASRPSGSTPATRRGRAAASPPTGVPLQTFQRWWFEQYIKEGKNAIKWTRLSCRTFAAKEILKNAEWILPFGTGVSYCLPPRQARPFHGEIRPSDLSFPWPFQHRGRLFLLSARSGEQSLFDNHQIGQRKQGM